MAKKIKGNPRALKNRVHMFSAVPSSNRLPTDRFTRPAVAGSAVQQQNNSDFVNYLNGISNFSVMTREDLVEHLYTTEPEIATAIDSFALMVRNSFQYFDLINYNEIDNIPDTLDIDGEELDFTKGNKLSKEMVDVANAIGKSQDIPSLYEQYGAILKLHGTLFILINENGSLTQLPNDHVPIIDKIGRIEGLGGAGNNEYEDLITEANYLVLDENLDTQRIYSKEHFMIIRYHDTPVYIEDCKGRVTYGIYGVSPLRRAIVSVWYRRIVMSNDAAWREKAFPREVHQLSAESFNTTNFTGTPKSKMEQAQSAASSAIEQHRSNISGITPDQPLVMLDTTDVKIVEPTNATHLEANAVIGQMTDSIFCAIGMPRSIVEGKSSSNYAGELIIYSHANDKIAQVANKISRAIIIAMKRKLLLMNAEYPVDLLDITTSFDLAANPLENAKIAQLMYAMGTFTDDEIRAQMKFKPLTNDQKAEIKKRNDMMAANKQKSVINNGGQSGATSDGNVKYPTTPQSANQQPSDLGDSKINDALGYES